MTIWEDWTRRSDGGRFALHMMVARRAAQLLGTRTGPDDDVIIDGRLVTVAHHLPFIDPRKPLTDEGIFALVKLSAQAFAIEHGWRADVPPPRLGRPAS